MPGSGEVACVPALEGTFRAHDAAGRREVVAATAAAGVAGVAGVAVDVAGGAQEAAAAQGEGVNAANEGEVEVVEEDGEGPRDRRVESKDEATAVGTGTGGDEAAGGW